MTKQTQSKKDEQQQTSNEQKQSNQKRQIVIETDGNNISLTKAEVAGSLELKSILSSLLDSLNNNQQNEK
ncbi:MAG: hypothetical protein ACOCTT_03815 [archaeon]